MAITFNYPKQARGTATPNKVVAGETFESAQSPKIQIGEMEDMGALIVTPSTVAKPIPEGYHDGYGYVEGSAQLVPANIRKDVTIFNVKGSLEEGSPLEGDAEPSDVRAGKEFMNAGGAHVGTLPEQPALIVTPKQTDTPIPAGIHDGTGKVEGIVIPKNKVLEDTTIAGQTGTMIDRGAVTITPSANDQVIHQGYHSGGGKVEKVTVPVTDVVEGTTIAGQVGTLPNRNTGNHTTSGITRSGNTLRFAIPAIARYGTGANIQRTDNNWIEDNIRQGVNMFGKVGTLVEGKRWAKGGYAPITKTSTFRKMTVTGLAFTPSVVISGASSIFKISPSHDEPFEGEYINFYTRRNGTTPPDQSVSTTIQGTSYNQFRVLPNGFEIIIADDGFSGDMGTWIAYE